jgi:predicted TPR repeat methyltransferase
MEGLQSSAVTTREALVSAIALHQSGRVEEAAATYLAVLETDRNNPDALHYLGLSMHQRGHSLLGINLIRRAIEMSPGYVDALNNLGNIYQECGGAADAALLYKRALELRPDHADASRNLAIALRKLERLERSVAEQRAAIEREPENVDHLYDLAATYNHLGRAEDTLDALRKALALKPEAHGFSNLGRLLYALRRVDEAAAAYEAWLRIEPDNPVPKHLLAACTQKDVPSRADDAFVTSVFDRFAATFDDVLRKIEYRAPLLVGGALRRLDGEPRGELDIVDAGCGTGLLAPYLRPYARRLVGVDLSPRMMEKAAKRAVYDETIVAELGAYLRSSPQAFDVIASSDTLVYFGDLREVLAAARGALRQGGRLLFTLEHATDESQAPGGYRIHPHGRYSHTEPYVRKTVADAGFELVDVEKPFLRREGESYVRGLLVLARRPQSQSPAAV